MLIDLPNVRMRTGALDTIGGMTICDYGFLVVLDVLNYLQVAGTSGFQYTRAVTASNGNSK
jgi:hypothetical protein